MIYIAGQNLNNVFYEFTESEYLADEDDSITGFDFINKRYIKGERERIFVTLIDEEIKINKLDTTKFVYSYDQFNISSKDLTIDGNEAYLAVKKRREKEYIGTDLIITQFYVLFVMLDVDDDYGEDMLKLTYNDNSYDFIEKKYVDEKVIYIYDFIMTDTDTSKFIDMLTEENFIVDNKDAF